MKKREEVYKDLKKKYSDEEIADSFLFSVELKGEDQQQAKEEFLKLRFEHLNAMSEEELVSAKLFAFKLNLIEYFKQDKFDGEFSFQTGATKRSRKIWTFTRLSSVESSTEEKAPTLT